MDPVHVRLIDEFKVALEVSFSGIGKVSVTGSLLLSLLSLHLVDMPRYRI